MGLDLRFGTSTHANSFPDFIPKTYGKVGTALYVIDLLSFQIQDGEWVFSRLHITNSQLTPTVLAPAPSCAIHINSSAD